mmetsp:Transcript_58251/g.180957  ORF Transcript_58251/g.180957 Transcript_58251/m.180957 type:complete len:241 (+) Transcript_58251:348-1070(+)
MAGRTAVTRRSRDPGQRAPQRLAAALGGDLGLLVRHEEVHLLLLSQPAVLLLHGGEKHEDKPREAHDDEDRVEEARQHVEHPMHAGEAAEDHRVAPQRDRAPLEANHEAQDVVDEHRGAERPRDGPRVEAELAFRLDVDAAGVEVAEARVEQAVVAARGARPGRRVPVTYAVVLLVLLLVLLQTRLSRARRHALQLAALHQPGVAPVLEHLRQQRLEDGPPLADHPPAGVVHGARELPGG